VSAAKSQLPKGQELSISWTARQGKGRRLRVDQFEARRRDTTSVHDAGGARSRRQCNRLAPPTAGEMGQSPTRLDFPRGPPTPPPHPLVTVGVALSRKGRCRVTGVAAPSCCGPSGCCRRPDRKSRMRREPRVRFREGAEVKFPRARPMILSHHGSGPAASRQASAVAAAARFQSKWAARSRARWARSRRRVLSARIWRRRSRQRSGRLAGA